jgi:class 3 adenylate cyclase/tetratricopeptide (TPR) repeat protein
MGRPVVHDLGVYLPRIVLNADLARKEPRSWEIDGSLCFVDISGFTALSERLARRGRVGAEILTEVLNDVFSRMLAIAYDKGGSLLKFGGDALLLMFSSADHPLQAVQSAVAMRAALRQTQQSDPSVGRIALRMSVGIHSGPVHLFQVGSSHRELLICGPGASETVAMEQTAEAGEIVVSAATAGALPRGYVGQPKGRGFLLRSRTIVSGGPGPVPVEPVPAAIVELGIPVALRDHLAAAEPAPEHRLATVAFVKYRGLDTLLANDGVDATASALDHLIASIQDAVDGEQVTFLASDIDADGGKVILATGVPRTHDDDEGRMLRAIRHIADTRSALSVRIGVNRGHVFVGDIGTDFRRTFTIMGDTVNLAARLMAAAPDGDVYATVEVLDRSNTMFDVDTVPPFRVKGKLAPVQAYRIGAERGGREQRRSSSPFLGRHAELERLEGGWDSALRGAGSVIVIEADRGVGKSRLVDELRGRTASATTLVLQGEPYGAGTPYQPLRRPLRQLLGVASQDPSHASKELDAAVAAIDPSAAGLAPLLGPALGVELADTAESGAVAPGFRRDRAFDLIVRLLDASQAGPVHFVVEDAHWLDEATGAFIERAAAAAAIRPWLMTVTRRPGGVELRLPMAEELALGPLGEDAARELVAAATATAPMKPHENDAIVARAGGNPLFVEELVQVARITGVTSLPDTLDAVANAEIDALPPRDRQVLRHASVLGASFELDLLLALLDRAQLDLEHGAFARLGEHLVNDGVGRFRFRHGLLREAAYEGLPYRRRRELHRLAGEALEGLAAGAPEERADALSLHFSIAQAWPQAWRYAPLAGRRARLMQAPAEAALHFQRAVDAARHLPDHPVGDVAPVWRELGDARFLMGDYGLADQAFARAAALTADDLPTWADHMDQRVFVTGDHLMRQLAAVRLARRAISRLDGLTGQPAEAARARLLAREALVRTRQGRHEDALRICERVIQMATAAGELRALTIAYTVTDLCLLELGRVGEANHLAAVVGLHEELGEPDRVGITLMNMGAISYFKGDWDEAASLYQRAAAVLSRAGDVAAEAMCYANLGELRANQGRLDEAETELRRADRTQLSIGHEYGRSFLLLQLARVCASTARDGEALELVELATKLAAKKGRAATVEAHCYLVEAHIAAGRRSEALAAAEAARAMATNDLQGTPVGCLLDRVEAMAIVASGRTEAGIALTERSVPVAREVGCYYDLVVLLDMRCALGGAGPEPAEELQRLLGRLGIVRLPFSGLLQQQ